MKTILTFIANVIAFNFLSQTIVYDSTGKKRHYIKQEVNLEFSPSSIQIPSSSSKNGQESIGALATVIPGVIDVGFKVFTNILESRIKKFSGEYQIQKSYLEAGGGKIPNLTFTRKVTIGTDVTALKLELKAKSIPNGSGFVYYVDYIELGYSKALWKRRHNGLDYTIEIIPTFLVNKEKKSQELAPISLTGVKFGKKSYNEDKYRTTFIPIPEGSLFLDAGIKIIETNPAKIKTEKIMEIYSKYKEDVVTIINNILPSDDKK